jgi:hypothetical protein
MVELGFRSIPMSNPDLIMRVEREGNPLSLGLENLFWESRQSHIWHISLIVIQFRKWAPLIGLAEHLPAVFEFLFLMASLTQCIAVAGNMTRMGVGDILQRP